MKNEIAIIGSGPSGLSCAIELKKLGHKNIVVYEREDEAGGAPRHCGHLGFGIFEFYRVLTGPSYSKKLVDLALKEDIEIKLNYTLIDIEEDNLIFSTPNGIKKSTPQKTIFAMGARETPRASRLTTGSRSPNIITAGALQRFIYLQKRVPFKNAVIIGTEVVGFASIMTARDGGMKIDTIIEEDENLNSFGVLEPLTEVLLNTSVKVGYEIVSINGNDKNIESITISKEGKEETIKCDGIIFTGKFTPESAIAQKVFKDFNYNNNSMFISQTFQTQNKNFFATGNVIRGALTAFNCYFEGQKVAKFVDKSIKSEKSNPIQIPIIADENIEWYYPSLVDLSEDKEILTTLRMKKKSKGKLIISLNDNKVSVLPIDAKTYNNIKIPSININLKSEDKIYIRYEEATIL